MRISPPHVASNSSTTNNHKLPKPYWRKYSPIAPVNGPIKSQCKQCCEYQQRRVHYKLAEKLQSFSVFALFSCKGATVLLSPVTTNRLQHRNINITKSKLYGFSLMAYHLIGRQIPVLRTLDLILHFKYIRY